MSKQPIEMFTPPNMLKAKAGGTVVGLDMAAIRRAETALASLQGEFDAWIADDVRKLVENRKAFAQHPSKERGEEFYRTAHDLRGQARTFAFPLVERVATSLCRLLEVAGASVPAPLIDAHVDAIRVIVREQIKDGTNAVASSLAKELECRVEEFLGDPPSRP